ncbi:MAG TPA: GNAT family protein [Candidatus Limnocylindrales bacterium]|nr:GNAT family protein [Candidatus Limnocylindrales bacterium]
MSWLSFCKRTGMHVSRRRHLLVVSARTVDYVRHNEFAADPEALHWLGWDPAVVAAQSLPLVARQPIVWEEWAMPPTHDRIEFTAIDRATLALAGQLGIRREGDDYHVGGVMHKAYRGQGLGTEFLTTVMRLAHKHFGIRRVLAGCERDNAASVRWLTKSGFAPAEGPQTYRLDNGREVKTIWWQHIDERARLRCPLLSCS